MDTRISIKSIRNRVECARGTLSREAVLQYKQTTRTVQLIFLINRRYKCKNADVKSKQTSSLETGGIVIDWKLKRVSFKINKPASGWEQSRWEKARVNIIVMFIGMFHKYNDKIWLIFMSDINCSRISHWICGNCIFLVIFDVGLMLSRIKCIRSDCSRKELARWFIICMLGHGCHLGKDITLDHWKWADKVVLLSYCII